MVAQGVGEWQVGRLDALHGLPGRFGLKLPGHAVRRARQALEAGGDGMECRVAEQSQSLRQVLVQVSRPGRRTGAIMLVDEGGVLTGVFTDSDLARLLESSGEGQLDQPIANCMSKRFQTIRQGEMLPTAMAILAARKISELPVVNGDGRPVGLIDITDVMSALSSALPGPSEQLILSVIATRNPTECGTAPRILPLRRQGNISQDNH